MRITSVLFPLFVGIAQTFAAETVISIPMNQQINLGFTYNSQSPSGDAIYTPAFTAANYQTIETTEGGFTRQHMAADPGTWWYQYTDFNLAGITTLGNGLVVSNGNVGTRIEFETRFLQDSNLNTNPYGDAPVFVRLYTYDADGNTYLGFRDFGIVYATQGPWYNKPYPDWTRVKIDTITNTFSEGVNAAVPGAYFSVTNVSRLRWYGTDWAGHGTDFVDFRNLKVILVGPEPMFLSQDIPTATRPMGGSITLGVEAGGRPPFTYQWKKGGAEIAGATGASLTLTDLQLSDSGTYSVTLANSLGNTNSSSGTLTVVPVPPEFTSQNISNVTRTAGGWVQYSVGVAGSPPFTYEWKRNGTAIAGATTPTLRLTNLQVAQAGDYSITVSNPYGFTNSITGTLTVTPLAATGFAAAAMANGPLAYYRFNEASGTTAVDIAGALDGTHEGPVVPGMAGAQPPIWSGFEAGNTGYQFVYGNSTRVRLPSFNLKTNQITIVALINPSGPQLDQTGILVSRSGEDLGGMFIDRSGNGELGYVWSDTPSWNSFSSGLVPVANQWNFVALVVEPTKGTLYLDDLSGSGIRFSSYSASHRTLAFDLPMVAQDTYGNRWFDGGIDEVVVYDRALSPGEIANLALYATAGPVAPRIVQQPASATVFADSSATFTVSAAGATPLSYQWRRAGANIPGATTTSLNIPNAWFTDAVTYDVVVSNSLGSSNSQPATLTVVPTPSFANLTNQLVLHLKFEGDYQDSSGRGNNAMGNGTTFGPGKIGTQAVYVNTVAGSGAPTVANYVFVGALPDFAFTETDSFSVSFWAKYTSWDNDLPMIGNAIGSTYQLGWVFTDQGGKIELSLCDTPNSGKYVADPVAGSPIIEDGAWHNVVGVMDRATATASVYVDGLLAGSFSIAGLTTLDYAALVIGQNPDGNYNVNGAGHFDDIGIWRRALSPTEAQSIYIVGQENRSFDAYGPIELSIRKTGANVEITWQAGTLQQADTINGTFTDVQGATAPYYSVAPGSSSKFYRVRQ